MKSERLIAGCGSITRTPPRRAFHRKAPARAGALAAVLLCFIAQIAAAEVPRAAYCGAHTVARLATPAAWSRPAESDAAIDWTYGAFRGLSCARCNSATQYC